MKQKKTIRATFTQKASLAGRLSRFPVDMLRYDNCHPATETDSGKIAATFDDMLRDEPIEITLEKIHTRHIAWSEVRWNSFGWELLRENRD